MIFQLNPDLKKLKKKTFFHSKSKKNTFLSLKKQKNNTFLLDLANLDESHENGTVVDSDYKMCHKNQCSEWLLELVAANIELIKWIKTCPSIILNGCSRVEGNIGLWSGVWTILLFLENLCRMLSKLWRFDTKEWMVEIQFDALCIKVLSTVFHMRCSEYVCIKCMLCDCWESGVESMCLCLIMYSNPVLL